MKLKAQTTLILSAIFVVAGIALTMALGLWQTETDKIPRKLQSVTAQLPQSEAQPESATQYDPADIRGSYTFGEISELFNVPLSEIATAFGLTQAEAGAFQVKGLEARYPDAAQEIGTASVRMFVAYYLGVAYTPSEETYLPASAAGVLTENGQMTAEQNAYLAAHTF